MPVVVRALGKIKKGTDKYINETPANMNCLYFQESTLNVTRKYYPKKAVITYEDRIYILTTFPHLRS